MEWTKRMLIRFEEPLKQAGIFGAVGVSQFSYHFDANIWRPLCELRSPLTNTLHHGAGEVSISLYDLERIGGLPILGAIYKELLPSNKDLTGHNKYPAIVVELLCIHLNCVSSIKLSMFIVTSGWTIFIENSWCTLHMGNKQILRKRRSRKKRRALFLHLPPRAYSKIKCHS